MSERSQVQFGTTLIRFRVRRSVARRQVSLVVEAGRRGLVVYAPADVDVGRLRALVRQRGAWVLEKLRAAQASGPASSQREFVSGESFTYLGRSFRLRVREAATPEQPHLAGGWFTVTVAPRLSVPSRARAVRAAMVTWYRTRAAEKLPDRLKPFVNQLGLPQPRVLLRDQARRWGSCNEAGEVRINWRIVQAPTRLVEYVLAHEVVHLAEKNHTVAFWSMLGKLVPDVDARRAELRERGSSMLW